MVTWTPTMPTCQSAPFSFSKPWISACDWYMKADADSFLNVPLLEERLRCFDPSELWFLGVPQVAHSSTGTMTRFASGGAGYVISRALVGGLGTFLLAAAVAAHWWYRHGRCLTRGLH